MLWPEKRWQDAFSAMWAFNAFVYKRQVAGHRDIHTKAAGLRGCDQEFQNQHAPFW